MKALLIICAVNEGVKIAAAVERIYGFLARRRNGTAIDFLIVDDGSNDGAIAPLARQYGFPVLRNDVQRGVGYSIREAYNYGRKNGYDILLTMAGNNKDNPEELDRLIEPIAEGRADFVQGSRYLPGGNYGNMPPYRLIATRILHPFIFSCVAGQRITDSTNGFRSVRTSLLKDERINLNQEWLDQYELEPYLFCQAIRLGYRVTEAPVSKIYPDKKLGYSKMKPITGWWSILKPLFILAWRKK